MTRFKDFGSPVADKEEISFSLHGEKFTAVPQIQGRILMSFVERASSNDPAAAAAITIEFFEKVLTDESWERFNALTSSKTKVVSVETLAEIVSWLIEEYAGRPEEQREV